MSDIYRNSLKLFFFIEKRKSYLKDIVTDIEVYTHAHTCRGDGNISYSASLLILLKWPWLGQLLFIALGRYTGKWCPVIVFDKTSSWKGLKHWARSSQVEIHKNPSGIGFSANNQMDQIIITANEDVKRISVLCCILSIPVCPFTGNWDMLILQVEVLQSSLLLSRISQYSWINSPCSTISLWFISPVIKNVNSNFSFVIFFITFNEGAESFQRVCSITFHAIW